MDDQKEEVNIHDLTDATREVNYNYQCLLLVGRGLANKNAQPKKENSRLSVLISPGLTGHNNGLRIIYFARRLSRSFSHTANERRR